MKYYAHSLETAPKEEWQLLQDHLENVAGLAKEFASFFNAGDWAYLAGLWHDWGKGSKEFQAYLRHAHDIVDEFNPHYRGRVDHASFGAQQAFQLSAQAGKLLAYMIAGHHSGLMNGHQDEKHGLKYRLNKEVCSVDFGIEEKAIPVKLPIQMDQERFGFQMQFFVRMLFSCLVDADFLDAEKFMNPEGFIKKENKFQMEDLKKSFWKGFNKLRGSVEKTGVNRIREGVLNRDYYVNNLPSYFCA